MKNKQTIILFSNPFGYGPTTTLIHIAKEILKKTDVNLVWGAKKEGLCREIFNVKNKIIWHDINERDFNEVKKLIAKYPQAKVISILNRFSIRAAKELGNDNALVDFLSWFWETAPEEYSLADIYFTNNLKKKIDPINSNTIDVPIILGPIPEKKEEDIILINIGGSKNPLVSGIPTSYLLLLSKILNMLNFGNSKVYIAGGKEATAFIRKHISNNSYKIGSMSHEEFLSLHRKAKRFISLSGTNATFMSFALNVPTIFLLPQLLAHWKLSLLLKDQSIPSVMLWEDYFLVDENIYSFGEKEIVPITESFSQKMIRNNQAINKYAERIQCWIDGPADTKEQEKFIKKVGLRGEEAVVSKLIEAWNL